MRLQRYRSYLWTAVTEKEINIPYTYFDVSFLSILPDDLLVVLLLLGLVRFFLFLLRLNLGLARVSHLQRVRQFPRAPASNVLLQLQSRKRQKGIDF